MLLVPEARGHYVLVVPVPELEDFVRARWAHYEPVWVSKDPTFTHAHITALAPLTRSPSDTDLQAIGKIAAAAAAFDFALHDVEEHANGSIVTRPLPEAPFADLTAALWAAFPESPPYGGQHEVRPHVTLDHRSAEVTADSTRSLLGQALPAQCRATRLELQWYEEGKCHVVRSWPLGIADERSRSVDADCGVG